MEADFLKRFRAGNFLLVGSLLLVLLGVSLSLVSFFPNSGGLQQGGVIVDDTFCLSPNETYREGLGSFHGDETITLYVNQTGTGALNFTLLTYNGQRYSTVSAANLTHTFPAGADYYEVAFQANAFTATQVHLQAFVIEPSLTYPFSWLSLPAKILFYVGWATLMLFILLPFMKHRIQTPKKTSPLPSFLKGKRLRWLQVAVLLSLAFWLVLLVVNAYPMATFENWYTDSARHPYTSILFTKTGFSVFDTPLGVLSNADHSFYKFVTWPEMPNLYPIGSVFLYLPFGALLEGGISQALVYKLELALLLVVSHVCLYLFLKRFWKQDLNFALKALAVYIFYIVLVVFAANGQSDSVAFLFSILAVSFFLQERYDLFLLLGAVSTTFKYQAGIFLLPFVVVSLIKLFQASPPKILLKNKVFLAAVGLAVVDLFTAYLSAPFLSNARPELIMNVANAFNPHAQIPWGLQALAVSLTLALTLTCTLYVLNRTRLMALCAAFTLLPIFSMPYFQPWYLLFFFVYLLIPQSKPSLRASTLWLVLVALILTFGGIAFNPLALVDNIRHVLGF